MNNQTQDGDLPSGIPFPVTVIETITEYILDNFSRDENSKKLTTMGTRGRPRRNKIILGETSFSADCQLADITTVAPERRQTFAADADRDGNVEPYQIEKVGEVLGSDAEWKCKISGFAMENPLPYRSPATLATGDLTISPIAVTGANSGDLFTATAHGLVNTDRVTLTVTTGLTGLTTATDYFVVAATTDTFQLAATSGGSAITFSADGTGFVSKGVDFAAYLPKGATAAATPWSSSGLPTGLTLDSTTGKISGKATAGTYSSVKIKYSATRIVDGVSETLLGVRKFNWTVS